MSRSRGFVRSLILALVTISCLAGGRAFADSSANAGPPAAKETLPAPPTLSVFAAASLQDALKELADLWRAESRGELEFNFGSSSDLARQIEAAPRADVFVSADEASMDRLVKSSLIDPGSRRTLLSNRLVVIAPADSKLTLSAASELVAPGIRRLALADTQSVPAGKYAKAWLEKAGIWEQVKERVIPTLDVRACLATVESGNVEAGVVYRTDATSSRKVRILYEVPAPEGPVISYPVAVLAERPNIETARRFAAWLATDSAGEVFRRHGFVTLGAQGKP